MQFVTPIITPIVESLIVPVKKHLGFLFSSTKYVRNMSDKLLELNHTKHDMEEMKKNALMNDQLIPDSVLRWFEQVETINEDARNIPIGGNGCLSLKMSYKAGKRSFNIVQKIDDLLEKKKELKFDSKQRPLGMVISSAWPSTSETDYNITQNMFKSRQFIFKDVLKSLELDSKTQMMALCGMGGVGKTTMMEDIKKVVEKRGMFQWVLKVDIGKKYDIGATQKTIGKCIGLDLNEETKDAMAARLEKCFKEMSENGTKKILVILDDVWEPINLKDIGLTSPFPKSFKLLVTSRNKKVCLKMGIETSSIVRIDVLEEVEADSFFEKTAGVSDWDGELCTIKKDILKKCGGLPIAIKTLALALRDEPKDAWEVTQKCLQHHNLRDIEDLEDIVHRIFEISYNFLTNDYDKAIFVLCGLFPDDFDISLEELLRYGWGLHFFNIADSLVQARKRTNLSVGNLIRVNLLTESYRVGHVKMHDLAQSFVLSNISKFKQSSIVNHGDKSEWPTQDTQESCERILLTCKGMSEFPQDFYYPNLALLKLINGDQQLNFPEDFYKRMEKIEVISYHKMRHPLHLVSLQCSSTLRTLCLNSCSLVEHDISFLGDLVNLEILSITWCGIRKLPSTLRKLKNLKLLDLTGCVDLCIDDGVFQNLDKLEELYMGVSRKKTIRFTNANCGELEKLSRKLYALEVELCDNFLQPKNVSFKTLERFRISMGCFLEVNPNDTYSFKNTLKLVTNSNDLLECKINELFSKTEELHLSVKDISYIEDILMSSPQHSSFGNLKVLHVFECAMLTNLFTIPVANGLKKLESLRVSSCPVLKSLVTLCDNLNVMELPQLLELELSDLPNFTSIILGDDSSATQQLLNNKVVFQKLKKLKVDGLKKLKQIWACDITRDEEGNVSALREIEVNACDSLVNLFPVNAMRLLSHLEKLTVERCCSIEVLFNLDFGKIEQHRSNNTSNLKMIKVYELKELREVWRINEKNNSGTLIRAFQAVETIYIGKCKKFRSVFTPKTANLDMEALVTMNIIGEEKVELDNNSQEEELSGISKLQEISKTDDNMSLVAYPSYHLLHTFNRIRNIKFRWFEEAEVVFELGNPSSNRELVTTQQQPLPLLPYLEDLELRDMYALSYVWKCSNWNAFFILHKHQPQSSFQNLTTIQLSHCGNLKYLFSPLMARLLSRLKTLEIENCEGMEEVVSNRDDDDEEEIIITSTTTLFPCLDYLRLDSLSNLKHIGGSVTKGKINVIHDQSKFSQVGVVSCSLCQYSRKIEIENCDALSSLVPSYAAGEMQRLQELTISKCTSLVEIFETKEISNNNISNIDQGSDAAILIPNTKNITMHNLTNLKSLKIYSCHLLEYTFTFSMLENLVKLEDLNIDYCNAMKVIVRDENEDASSKKVVVVLPRLKSIKLEDLPNIAGFFVGMNIDFELPSLDYVSIIDCPQMTLFTSGESRAPKLKYIRSGVGKHYLKCGLNFHQISPPSSDSLSLCSSAQGTPWSFHNLIEINASHRKKIVLSNELVQMQNLERICLDLLENVEEVFEVTDNESQAVVKFPKLSVVVLFGLRNLKHIWKSNQRRILEFPNLTRLRISRCNHLKHVLTSSMVGSLMQLQELKIRFCYYIKVIVKNEEECDGKVGEIMFPCLKFIELLNLRGLEGFCLPKEDVILPSLNTLEIRGCPKITYFSKGRSFAPQLNLVETRSGFYHVGEDINSIMTKQQEENIFE